MVNDSCSFFNYYNNIYDPNNLFWNKLNTSLFDLFSYGHMTWGILFSKIIGFPNYIVLNILHLLFELYEASPYLNYINQYHTTDYLINTIGDFIAFNIGLYLSEILNSWQIYLLILSGEILSYTLFPYYYGIPTISYFCPYTLFFCGLILFIVLIAKYEMGEKYHNKKIDKTLS